MHLPLGGLAAALLLVTAGCLGAVEDPSLDPSSSPDQPPAEAPRNESAPRDAPIVRPGDEGTGQFCEDESGCTFWDDAYHEYVVYDVDTPVLDVLIAPAAAPDALGQTEAMRNAVTAWAEGVKLLGAPWMVAGFQINVYVLGVDEVPQEAREDPEILVLGAEYNPALLFGIGLEPKQAVCDIFGQQSLRDYEVHAHHGMEVRAADCTGMGFTCVAVNTNFLFGGAVYMQDLVAHEVGHCLGGGHVGDALDFRAKAVPVQDIMSYQHDEDQVHCVSSLNVRVLEGLYAPLIEGGDAAPLAAGDYYTMDPADYVHVDCPTA